MSVGKGRSKPLVVDGVEYPSRAAYCKTFGIRHNALVYRLSKNMPDEQLMKRRLRSPRQSI